MKLIVVDIEDIPTRYTAQWKSWFKELFTLNDIDYTWIGFDDVVKAKKDEFLSFIPSNDYKARQIQKIASDLTNNQYNDGDMILFLDAWHPGVVAVRQMLLTYDKDIKLAGFWHAGSYDRYDYLGQKGSQYFISFEKGLYDCLDFNLYATEFSKELFFTGMALHSEYLSEEKAYVVGFLYKPDHLKEAKKEKLIIFPHRLAIEKQPYMFEEFEAYCRERIELGDYKFVKTLDVTENKEQYHGLLAASDFAISFARQETFGISMMESMYSGCVPIVPNHLSYTELYPKELQYNPTQMSRDSIYSDILGMIKRLIEQDKRKMFRSCQNIMNPVVDGSKMIDFLTFCIDVPDELNYNHVV